MSEVSEEPDKALTPLKPNHDEVVVVVDGRLVLGKIPRPAHKFPLLANTVVTGVDVRLPASAVLRQQAPRVVVRPSRPVLLRAPHRQRVCVLSCEIHTHCPVWSEGVS